jgi:hypothetical protein
MIFSILSEKIILVQNIHISLTLALYGAKRNHIGKLYRYNSSLLTLLVQWMTLVGNI